MLAFLGMAVCASQYAHAAQKSETANFCRVGVFEGEVRADESFARPIGGGLEFRLEALSWGSGWLVRVLPQHGPRPAHDYAELATPPYASVSPLLLSTDYSFRAQDAVAWNPRRFRFAAGPAQFSALEEAFARYSRKTSPGEAAERDLATLVSRAPEGTLQILDARFVPGTANQAQTAALVASHFNTTAHTVQDAETGAGPLGKLVSLHFRISFQIPIAFMPAAGIHVTKQNCR